MATTKALELAQLSALTTVDASSNVTTNTSQIANASGDLTLVSAADIILNADGADIILKDDTVDFGRFKRDNGHLVIKSETIDKSVIIKGTTTSNATVTALTFDMANGGRATFNENVIIQGNLTVEGTQTTLNTTALDVEDKNITLNYHPSNNTSGSADGAGITIQDAVDASTDASILWDATNDKFTMSHGLTLLGATHLQFTRGGELRSTDTGGTVRTLVRVNGSNELEYGWSGSGAVKFMGGGSYTERIRIHTNANIGINDPAPHGTLTVTGPRILVQRTNDDSSIAFANNATGAPASHTWAAGLNYSNSNAFTIAYGASGVPSLESHKMVIDTSGNVGIGTDGPATPLHIKKAGSTSAVQAFIKIENNAGGGAAAGSSIDFHHYHAGGGPAGGAKAASITAQNMAPWPGGTPSSYSTGLTFGTLHENTFDERVRISSNGNVGIGDTNPSALRLSVVTPTANHVGLQVVNSNTSDSFGMVVKAGNDDNDYTADFRKRDNTNIMRIRGDGNVGIGMTAPTSKLEVFTTDQDFEDGSNAIRITHPAGPAQYNVGGGIVFAQRWYASSTQDVRTGGIYGFKTIGSGAYGGGLAFYSQPNNSNAMNRSMIINHAGNVGIGADTPGSMLTIQGNEIGGQTVTHLHLNSGNNTTSYPFLASVNNDDVSASTYGWLFRNSSDDGNLEIYRKNNSTTPNIVMAMTRSDGKVGIGTDAPVQTLDVDGTIGTRQVRHSIRPALNLDFANSKQLDPRITFYRNSIATYYDSNGILRYAIENEPRFDHDPATGESKGLLIEEPRDFLNTNSITINGGYWSFSNASASVKQALAPDGTYSADGLMANTVNDGHGVLKSFVPAANTYYTLTAYFKRGANRYAQIAWYYNEAAGASNYPTAYFDLDNGTFTHSSGINRGTTMTDVGNGWYRCSVTVLTDSTPSTSYFYAQSTATGSGAAYVGTGAIDTYYWGLQIEIGDNPSSFTPSDTNFTSRSSKASYFDENGSLRKAPVNAPRYGYKYDGNQWVETGLILEKQAVQRFDVSDAFYWSGYYPQIGKARTTDYFNCGEGFTRIVPSTTSAVHVYDRYETLAAAGQHCFSVFAKQSGYKYLKLEQSFGGNAIFDLDTGTVYGTSSSSVLAGIENYGSGIYRCFVSANITQTTSLIQRVEVLNDSRQSTYAGNGTSGIEIFGMQIESGQVPTSFIFATPGIGTTTTRSADVFSGSNYIRQSDEVDMIGKNLTSWYNPNGGSFYTEHDSIQGNANHWLWSLNDERTQYNHIDQLRGRLRVSPDVNNLADINGGVTLVAGTFSKMASRIKKDDFALSMDGNTVVTDTSVDHERNSTLLKIGARADGAGYLNGTLKVFRYYAKPLSDAELEALTENN